MLGQLLNLLTILSLMLCVAAVALWARSVRSRDTLEAARLHDSVAIESDAGRVSLLFNRAAAPWRPSRWTFEHHRHPKFIWDPTLIPPQLSILGIEWRTMTGPTSTFNALTVPYWAVVATAAVAPLQRLRRISQRRLRSRDSRCPSCGYDLTGNVSGVCPECGAAARSLVE